MKSKFFRVSLIASALAVVALVGTQVSAENNRVKFPDNLDQMVHYTTVKRGDVTENMLTSRAAIDAIKSGKPVPDGTHFVLADYRDGKIHRYFIMQKGSGWGADYDASRRTGDWHFQYFNADRTVKLNEDTRQCQSCHQGRQDTGFLYTHDQLRSFK